MRTKVTKVFSLLIFFFLGLIFLERIIDRNISISMNNFESFKKCCSFQVRPFLKTDIEILEIYKKIQFDNSTLQINSNKKSKNKLKIFVVPHSHNDPAWLKTTEDYYYSYTKKILDNMVLKLPVDPRRKFIWAEISFFSMWWQNLELHKQKIVRKLIKNKQLEFVTGGWVMNDEANTHWVSTLIQMVEGHQWLSKNFNYTPRTSWSIDPYGLSPVQALLVKKMGLRNMVVQRVHYSVKKELGQKQQLEFFWRQHWDNLGETDIFTHVMPFLGYDMSHTCGPNPEICRLFDFKTAEAINDINIAHKAQLLYDQYRKKSELFKTDVVLVPLGDDFTFQNLAEWDTQFNNYQKLFNYMNSYFNVEAKFGTLSDYFTAVHQEKVNFPSLSGDFFTYADHDQRYWSGCYTSRAFNKRMDRVLLSYIRAAETILTLAYLGNKSNKTWLNNHENELSNSRKLYSLFQHHDGITGTSTDRVVLDYGKKLISAMNKCQHIIQNVANVLISGNSPKNYDSSAIFYKVDDIIAQRYKILIRRKYPTRIITIFNSLTFKRIEVVSFEVSTPFIEVVDMKNQKIESQLSPVFENGTQISKTRFQLSFVATIPALGLVSYKIKYKLKPKKTIKSAIKIYNQVGEVHNRFFSVQVLQNLDEFSLRNNRLTAVFNNSGLLKAIRIQEKNIPVNLDFAKYQFSKNFNGTGTHLFLPEGNATIVQFDNPVINIIEGPILSFVMVELPYVRHIATLYTSSGADSLGIEIENYVNITNTSNFVLVMKLSTKIQNFDNFFTDLNGFEITRRKHFDKLPLQGNYYPIPTTAYIEDDVTRLTIVTASPLGVTSLKNGRIEVTQDMRIQQDINFPSKQIFRVLVEPKAPLCQATTKNHSMGFATLSSYVASQTLLNPLIRLIRTRKISLQANYISRPEFGVDFNVATLRTGVLINGQKHIGIIINRQFFDLCFADTLLLKEFPLSQGSVDISKLLSNQKENKLYKTSLSFLHKENEINSKNKLEMCPMEIQAFILE